MAKGKVTFDQERCKGCGLCASVCPVKIIFLDSEVMNNKGYNVATVKGLTSASDARAVDLCVQMVLLQ